MTQEQLERRIEKRLALIRDYGCPTLRHKEEFELLSDCLAFFAGRRLVQAGEDDDHNRQTHPGPLALTVEMRWRQGIEHNQRSIDLYKKIADIDFTQCGDSFSWKSGGDGDNGETLMYILDVIFDMPQPPASTTEALQPASVDASEAYPDNELVAVWWDEGHVPKKSNYLPGIVARKAIDWYRAQNTAAEKQPAEQVAVMNDRERLTPMICAFWRRIYPYRNDYGKELPMPLPIAFVSSMATAMYALPASTAKEVPADDYAAHYERKWHAVSAECADLQDQLNAANTKIVQMELASRQSPASVDQYRNALARLRRADNCWCEMAVGNPNLHDHTAACKEAQRVYSIEQEAKK